MSRHAAVLFLAFGVVACSGGDKIVSAADAGGGATVLSAADSAYLANLVANQAIVNFKNLRVMQAVDVAAIVGTSLPAGCRATLSGAADANGNGIAEDQTLTFAAATCTVTQGNATTRVTGAVRVQDLGTLRGYRVTYTGLTQAVTVADTTLTVEANGPVEVQWSSATAGRTQNSVTTRITRQERSGSAAATFGANVTTAFAASAGGQIQVGRNLPAGTFTMTGSLTTTLTSSGTLRPAGIPATATYAVAITTATTMAYDGACLSDRAFGAGRLAGTVSGYASGSVSTAFTGCGAGTTPPPGTKR
jgi:hypothetical protein